MHLHNLIWGSSPTWNSKHAVPKVHTQLKGRAVVDQ